MEKFKCLHWIMPAFLLTSALLMLVDGKQKGSAPNGAKPMSFKAPELDEEGQWSNHVPSTLQCEGCKAITYKVT